MVIQQKLSTLDWSDLVRRMGWDLNSDGLLDKEVSSRLENITQTNELWYNSYKIKEYPNTINKLNEVVFKHLNSSEADKHLSNLDVFTDYLTPEVKDRVLDLFIENRYNLGWRIKHFSTSR
jgi:hypothetical protein